MGDDEDGEEYDASKSKKRSSGPAINVKKSKWWGFMNNNTIYTPHTAFFTHSIFDKNIILHHWRFKIGQKIFT